MAACTIGASTCLSSRTNACHRHSIDHSSCATPLSSCRVRRGSNTHLLCLHYLACNRRGASAGPASSHARAARAPPSACAKPNTPRSPLETAVAELEETYRRSPSASEGGVARKWREYHGEKEWEGLMEPLDAELRSEILKYGGFAQATYDGFDAEEGSSNRGNCRYEAHELLRRAGLREAGYRVTKYIYATADVHMPKWFERNGGERATWSKDSNWMGFVAVASGEEEIARLGRRDIVVAWRGTVTPLEWLEDLDGALVDIPCEQPQPGAAAETVAEHPVRVERGFWTLYTSAEPRSRYNKTSAAQQVRDEVAHLVHAHAHEQLSITMTGHSLGGALATLSAFDLAASRANRRPSTHPHPDPTVPISVISFAAPRVGNHAFERTLHRLGARALRVVNAPDLVPKLPGIFINESLARSIHLQVPPSAYFHVGVELRVNNTHSPFLKRWASPIDSHNLDVYLHLVDGYRSIHQPFTHTTSHLQKDLALVNKCSGLLVDDLHIPTQWLHKLQSASLPNHVVPFSAASIVDVPFSPSSTLEVPFLNKLNSTSLPHVNHVVPFSPLDVPFSPSSTVEVV